MYAGIQMRSRLEASFAEWLDADSSHGWEYEGQCFASKDGQYLPDFHIEFGWRDDWEYAEVKPENADFDAALNRMHIILASEPWARLRVWTRTSDADFPIWVHPFKWVRSCTPDWPCGCDREKWPRGYDRP